MNKLLSFVCALSLLGLAQLYAGDAKRVRIGADGDDILSMLARAYDQAVEDGVKIEESGQTEEDVDSMLKRKRRLYDDLCRHQKATIESIVNSKVERLINDKNNPDIFYTFRTTRDNTYSVQVWDLRQEGEKCIKELPELPCYCIVHVTFNEDGTKLHVYGAPHNEQEGSVAFEFKMFTEWVYDLTNPGFNITARKLIDLNGSTKNELISQIKKREEFATTSDFDIRGARLLGADVNGINPGACFYLIIEGYRCLLKLTVDGKLSLTILTLAFDSLFQERYAAGLNNRLNKLYIVQEDLYVIDLTKKELLQVLELHNLDINQFAMNKIAMQSNDGLILAAVAHGGVYLLNMGDDTCTGHIPVNNVVSLDFTKDNRYLVIGVNTSDKEYVCESCIYKYDLETRQITKILVPMSLKKAYAISSTCALCMDEQGHISKVEFINEDSASSSSSSSTTTTSTTSTSS